MIAFLIKFIVGDKLDKRSEKLLKYINNLGGESYKVIELVEILDKLPKKYHYTIKDIQNILKFLEEREYIDIKFVDDKNMCVAALPKGRTYFENILQQNQITKAYRRLFISSMIVSGLMAFLGALIATYFLK